MAYNNKNLKSQYFIFLSFLLVAVSLLSGCNNAATNVAILDIDKVVKETGLGREMNDKLKNVQGQLESQLNTIQKELQSKVDEKKKKAGNKPGKKQQAELNNFAGQAQIQLQNAQRQASDKLGQERARLITELREKIRPLAREIAESKGMRVVIIKNNAVVLDYSPETEITDDVIQALLKKKSDQS